MKPLDIQDLKTLAQKRVPRMFFDYADSGSYTESTYRANEADFRQINLRQRVGVDVSERSMRTKMVGGDVEMPIGLAPTGLCGMQYVNGEIHAIKAAEALGVPFVLSTMSICSLEDLGAVAKKPFWFQLYVMRDRSFAENLIARAQAVGCSTLVLTLDLQVLGQRHKDLRNGLTAPPRWDQQTLWQLVTRPRWCLKMLGAKHRTFGNIVGHAAGVTDLSSLSSWVEEQFDPTLSWEDVAWVKKQWPGKLVLKGILDADDARRAVQIGADAIIVSNHGGRQLDGAMSSISALPAIARVVGDDIEVQFDGGIRTGQDVLRALALGAKSTYIGRPYLYGLGAMGEAGVRLVLKILKKELSVSMALCGINRISEINRTHIARMPNWDSGDGILTERLSPAQVS